MGLFDVEELKHPTECSSPIPLKASKACYDNMLGVTFLHHEGAIRMIQDLTSLDRAKAVALLEKSDRRVKLALLMYWTGLDAATGEQQLAKCQGNLRQAIQERL